MVVPVVAAVVVAGVVVGVSFDGVSTTVIVLVSDGDTGMESTVFARV